MPIAAVSSGARPVYTLSGSYPNSDRVATSDAGVSAAGTLFASPTTPSLAARSVFGSFAAWSGVRPPRASSGSSAHPSGMAMTYFIQGILPELEDAPSYGHRLGH